MLLNKKYNNINYSIHVDASRLEHNKYMYTITYTYA